MDIRDLKEYTKWNLRRNGLVFSEKDRKAAQAHTLSFHNIGFADRILASFHHEVKEFRIERFCYANMSLTYWALVCMSVLGMLLDEYLKDGSLLITADLVWLLYILPAILLVGRMFLFSFINIAHLVLLGVCAVMTMLKIKIFGSEVNWIWVFIVIGTVFTLVGRLWEGTHRMKVNKTWFDSNMSILKNAEKALNEVETVYREIGTEAEAELQNRFPGIHRPGRTPWFLFSRKLDRSGTPKLPTVPEGHTDFIHQKKDRQEVIRTGTENGTRYITVTDQVLGSENMDAAGAQNLISSRKVTPYYGMNLPELADGLKYTLYSHVWSERIHETGETTRTIYNKRQTNAKRKAQAEYLSKEMDALGTTAEMFSVKTNSSQAFALTQDYLAQKEAHLNKLSDYELESQTITGKFDRRSDAHYNEIGALCVFAPGGELVGLYCTDNRGSIAFAQTLANKHWKAELTGWAMPSSEAQAGYLHGII